MRSRAYDELYAQEPGHGEAVDDIRDRILSPESRTRRECLLKLWPAVVDYIYLGDYHVNKYYPVDDFD